MHADLCVLRVSNAFVICFVFAGKVDEAEVLGDRVVVMSKGHVQTQGTATQLKEKLGA